VLAVRAARHAGVAVPPRQVGERRLEALAELGCDYLRLDTYADDLEAADREQSSSRVTGVLRYLSRGSRTSRSALPRRFRPSTVTRIAAPGTFTSHGARAM
jgi:hypothetical protein